VTKEEFFNEYKTLIKELVTIVADTTLKTRIHKQAKKLLEDLDEVDKPKFDSAYF